MFRFSRLLPLLLLAFVLALPPLLAYDTDLSDTAVREAYFLGQRNDEKTRAFFEPYTRHLPLPNPAPMSPRSTCSRRWRKSSKFPAVPPTL